jgi:hypothetical protein
MRPFFVLICSFALACAARGEEQQTKQAGHTKTSQHAATHGEHSTNSSAHQTAPSSPHVQHVQAPQDWWRSHYPRIVFVLGGWYYWHANYWYPAWGYQPEAVYGYDGPIYAFNDLEPDQVVANVQATLQQLGYYHGPTNGVLDPPPRTRSLITSATAGFMPYQQSTNQH